MLRIGTLGSSRISQPALIEPAASVPEVTVAAVAARDLARAEAFALRYGIPKAYGSYEELLADPDIDADLQPAAELAARAVDAAGDRGRQARAVREAVRVERGRGGAGGAGGRGLRAWS